MADDIKNEPTANQTTNNITPANFSYTHYLLSVAAHESKEQLIAALLPCYWIYQKLGEEYIQSVNDNHPYKKWINFYGSKEYKEEVDYMIDLTNRLAKSASEEERLKMHQKFVRASQLEWHFWNDSYNMRELSDLF